MSHDDGVSLGGRGPAVVPPGGSDRRGEPGQPSLSSLDKQGFKSLFKQSSSSLSWGFLRNALQLL